jgi:hypothetical protein
VVSGIVTPIVKRIYHLILLLGIGIISSRLAQADDFGYWGAYNMTFPINTKVDLIVRPELRFNDDAGNFHYMELQSGAAWHVHKHLDLASYFVFTRNKKDALDTFYTQYVERLDVTPKWTLATLPMTLRNRFEFRQMDGGTNRYRARFQINAPQAYTMVKLLPYIADEPFYDFDLKEYNQNRFFTGVIFPVDTRTDLNLYYLRQSTLAENGGWSFNDILGAEFRWRFR